jgi:hypothetical protein
MGSVLETRTSSTAFNWCFHFQLALLQHGPNPSGQLEVRLLSPKPKHGINEQQPVFAVRAFNASSTLDEFEIVAGMTVGDFPLWPHMLGRGLHSSTSQLNQSRFGHSSSESIHRIHQKVLC